MAKTNAAKQTQFEFNGKKYLALSSSDSYTTHQQGPINFGDVLADMALVHDLTEIAAFIKKHVSVRAPQYFSGADIERNEFLKFLVALGVISPFKIGSENGYIIERNATKEELIKAREYCMNKHDYGRDFAVFKGSEDLLRKASTKANNMLAYLLTTLFKARCKYVAGVKYSIDEVKNKMLILFTQDRVNKTINALISRGALEEYIVVNVDKETGEVLDEKTEVKFNRIQILPTDIEFYTNFDVIPAPCEHVHREDKSSKEKSSKKYFDDVNELIDFIKENIAHLTK